MENEIGRKLAVSELKVGTVVVVKPPDHQLWVTMWVKFIDEQVVLLHAGEMHWIVMNFIRGDSLVDDKGRTVEVFEYLGEI